MIVGKERVEWVLPEPAGDKSASVILDVIGSPNVRAHLLRPELAAVKRIRAHLAVEHRHMYQLVPDGSGDAPAGVGRRERVHEDRVGVVAVDQPVVAADVDRYASTWGAIIGANCYQP
ncbi:MAG: hypothetical protein M5U18_00870 [Dehalococcoidia bacterium]|nr:hypothetical protein [Dehalococcoidia bacterium]